MKFTLQNNTEAYSVLRFVSENNIWEIGIQNVMFGYRVCGGKVNNNTYEFSYCGGDNKIFTLELLGTIIKIFNCLNENISIHELYKMLPTYEIKPIDQDPCWNKLVQLSKKLELESLNKIKF